MEAQRWSALGQGHLAIVCQTLASSYVPAQSCVLQRTRVYTCAPKFLNQKEAFCCVTGLPLPLNLMNKGKEGFKIRSLTESQEGVYKYICTVGVWKTRVGVEDRSVYSLALSPSIDPTGGRFQALKDKAIFVLQFLFFPSFPLVLFQILNGCGLPHVYAPILTCLQWGHVEKNQRIGTFSDCKSQPRLSLCVLRT